jgi:hypothetical protein
VAVVHKRTIPTERPPLVGEVKCQPLRVEGVAWSAQRIPTAVGLGFLDRSRYFFIQVAPQLSLRGWVDPDPDSLLLRKSGRAGNQTRYLWICSQKLWTTRPQRRLREWPWYTKQPTKSRDMIEKYVEDNKKNELPQFPMWWWKLWYTRYTNIWFEGCRSCKEITSVGRQPWHHSNCTGRRLAFAFGSSPLRSSVPTEGFRSFVHYI